MPVTGVQTCALPISRVMEGADNGPLIGLYPHQWFNNASVAGKLGPSYDSIRGKIKLLAASQFKTEYRYQGFVPYWPGIKEGPRLDELRDLLKADVRKRRELIPGRENNDNCAPAPIGRARG